MFEPVRFRVESALMGAGSGKWPVERVSWADKTVSFVTRGKLYMSGRQVGFGGDDVAGVRWVRGLEGKEIVGIKGGRGTLFVLASRVKEDQKRIKSEGRTAAWSLFGEEEQEEAARQERARKEGISRKLQQMEEQLRVKRRSGQVRGVPDTESTPHENVEEGERRIARGRSGRGRVGLNSEECEMPKPKTCDQKAFLDNLMRKYMRSSQEGGQERAS